MTTLLTRWLRPKLKLTHWRVTVYTRAQCCCCHKAIDLLQDYQKRYLFALELVDIDADPELRARYDTSVPVVTINDKIRFKGIVNRVLLERLITAEKARS